MIRIILSVLILVFGTITPVLAEDWSEYKQQHFIIHYKKAPFDFVETVNQAAEQYYKTITNDLGFTRYKGWSWDDRATIYIYDNAEDYVNSGKQASWSHGVASPKDKVIRTYPSASGFFDTTLPHELAHIIFREFVGFKAQIPAWFEEGVAMSQEKARRWGSHNAVRQYLDSGKFISLDDLTITYLRYNTSRELIDLFYTESASAVNFLITEYGEQRFVRLCRKLKDGGPFEWALDSVYVRFKTITDLNDAWVKFLKNG